MEIIEELKNDLIKTDAWKYQEYANHLAEEVDYEYPVYEADSCEVNFIGIRMRKVAWTDKQGRSKSAEFTSEGIVFNISGGGRVSFITLS